MSDTSQQALEFIKYATSMEIGGRSFYEHAAERTTNEHGKKVFLKLAQDEIGHIKSFREIFTEVLGTDTWEQHVDKEETETRTLIDKLKKRLDDKGHEQRAGDLEAIRIGMELERNTIGKYEQWAKEATETKVQELFKRIIEEERFHYDLLQAEYDNITGSGFWFDMAEFRMDGKV